MPCEPFGIRNGKVKGTGWMCRRSRGKPETPRCYKCGKPATKLCDYRDFEVHRGHDEYGRPFTTVSPSLSACSRPMCDECANHYGEDADFCDEHNSELSRARAAEAERAYQQQLKRLGIEEGPGPGG